MQKKLFKTVWHNVVIFVFILLLLSACKEKAAANSLPHLSQIKTKDSGEVKPTSPELKPIPEPPKEPENPKDVFHEVSFISVGDVMVHSPQLRKAYVKEKDVFDFEESFEYIKPFIEAADYAFANLETTLAGRGKNHTAEGENYFRGFTGYPNFNSPESLADALKWAGFDFIGTANNHSLDKKMNGVVNTLKYLNQIGLEHTGTFDTKEERAKLKIVEVGGLKIGVIAYTYATNGISLAPEEMYRINTLEYYQKEAVEELYETVKRAKKEEIDYLYVLMHYGNEYWEMPEKKYQGGITAKLIELGVDMVIGSHPHTLQPLIYSEDNKVILEKKKAVSKKKNDNRSSTKVENHLPATKPVLPNKWNLHGIFSLGNFISSQRVISEYKTDTDTGAVIKWVYQWKNDEKPQLVKIGVLPTIVVWQDDRVTVLPIEEKAIEKAKQDPMMAMTKYVESRIENAKKTVLPRLTGLMPEPLAFSAKKEADGFSYFYLQEIK